MNKEAQKQADEHVEQFPELETEAIAAPKCEEVLPDCGDPFPIEIYEASVIEQKVAPSRINE
jgi:hypothetical protein